MATTPRPAVPAAPPAWRAWLAWAPAVALFGYAFVQRVAPSVMVAELMRDFGVGAAAIGQLAAFYFYAYAALQIPVGMMMDRVGPRRLMTAAAAVAAAGSFLFAASGEVALASIGRAMIGAGVAFAWVGGLVLAGAWFPAGRFGLLTGLGQLIGMIGGVFGQAPLGLAVETIGWRATVAVLGGVGVLLGLAAWTLTRDGPVARPHAPQAAGGLTSGIGVVMRSPQNWLGAWIALALSAPLLGFIGLWAVPFIGARYGLPRPEAAAIASLGFIGWGIGAPLTGWVSDRIGRRRPPLLAGTLMTTLIMLAIIYLPGLPPWGMGALMAVLGLFGASMIMTFAAAREHNPPSVGGAAIGFINTGTVGSGALAQPLIGWLLDLSWTGEMAAGARLYPLAAYETALLLLPAWSALAFAACLFYRETYCRQAEAGP